MRTLAIRFGIPQAGQPAMPGGIGVLAIAVEGFARTLVLLVDLQAANKGSSVTNGIEACIDYVTQRLDLEWPGTDYAQTDWIQLDSMGWFDRVQVRWGPGTGAGGRLVPIVCWEPLRVPNTAPRTLHAFLTAFDELGSLAFDEIQRYVDDHKFALRVNQERDFRVASD